jgi:RNA polymerase sigma-70 factor, ECF subfamily
VADLVRESYGRLLALLAAPSRDIAAAEDALADALEQALLRWPRDGIPANPAAWVLTVARSRICSSGCARWSADRCRARMRALFFEA